VADDPPGISSTSQASTSEYLVGTSTGSEPSTSVTRPAAGATKRIFAPGMWARISYGPMASSGSKRSKSKITMSMGRTIAGRQRAGKAGSLTAAGAVNPLAASAGSPR
jgi:hypothetical protein